MAGIENLQPNQTNCATWLAGNGIRFVPGVVHNGTSPSSFTTDPWNSESAGTNGFNRLTWLFSATFNCPNNEARSEAQEQGAKRRKREDPRFANPVYYKFLPLEPRTFENKNSQDLNVTANT